ncbi:MAG: ATP-binding cassette domain-containing protein [Acetivibrio ethanolgignens]
MSILINQVSKIYKNGYKALDNVSMEIGNGVCGLLGHNGAGKTTLMRIISTLLIPTEGNIEICGIQLKRENYDDIRRLIGYLPQELEPYPELTVKETLEYLGRSSGIPKTHIKERIELVLEKTNLVEHYNKKNKQLSGGMKRRVGLAQAMLNNPKILIIDEPTSGLDPEERIKIRKMLSEFGENCSVLFSTHVVEDLAATSNTLCILTKGKVDYFGTIQGLLQSTQGMAYETTVKDKDEVEIIAADYQIVNKIHTQEGIRVQFVSINQPSIRCTSRETTLEDAYIILNKYER